MDAQKKKWVSLGRMAGVWVDWDTYYGGGGGWVAAKRARDDFMLALFAEMTEVPR